MYVLVDCSLLGQVGPLANNDRTRCLMHVSVCPPVAVIKKYLILLPLSLLHRTIVPSPNGNQLGLNSLIKSQRHQQKALLIITPFSHTIVFAKTDRSVAPPTLLPVPGRTAALPPLDCPVPPCRAFRLPRAYKAQRRCLWRARAATIP